jgi:esterase/lipase superfamily enzyme
MAEETLSPIRWTNKFLRADAEQPVGITRMVLSEIRWNQWVLLQWRQIQESRFYPFKQNELLPRLRDANPEATLVQALQLDENLYSQTILNRHLEILAPLSTDFEEPWLHRKVLVDEKGNPLAIGAPVIRRPHRDEVSEKSYHTKDLVDLDRGRSHGEAKIAAPDDVPHDYSVIRIFYATDRSVEGEGDGAAYSNKRDPDETLHFGTCEVTIPQIHKIASLESPCWWKFELHWDPRKHIVLQQTTKIQESRFFSLLKATVSSTEEHSAFVFIHGFNVSFKDAARRTAQLSHDLEFKGVPILYSWPSASAVSGYLSDEATIEWTRPHLASFLSQIASRTGVSTLHVIAHSMGNRALLKALGNLSSLNANSPINQVVLTAPDIDSGEFMQIVASIRGHGERTTLYASSNDKAIQLSKKAHGYPRAGESGPDIVVVHGIDTIDASNVDTSFIGHSYFADKRTLLSDLFYLLREGKPPSERHSLEEKICSKGLYWAFRP